MTHRPIDDHPAQPGPGYWDWRCLRCDAPVVSHSFWLWLIRRLRHSVRGDA